MSRRKGFGEFWGGRGRERERAANAFLGVGAKLDAGACRGLHFTFIDHIQPTIEQSSIDSVMDHSTLRKITWT